RNHEPHPQARPREQPQKELHKLFGIDFKHAVEFSRIDHTPRFTLSGVAWGNSTYFSQALFPSQIGLFAIFRPSRITPGLVDSH
ncbi:hypothetical protein, partial [Mariniluteicoccus flavus]